MNGDRGRIAPTDRDWLSRLARRWPPAAGTRCAAVLERHALAAMSDAGLVDVTVDQVFVDGSPDRPDLQVSVSSQSGASYLKAQLLVRHGRQGSAGGMSTGRQFAQLRDAGVRLDARLGPADVDAMRGVWAARLAASLTGMLEDGSAPDRLWGPSLTLQVLDLHVHAPADVAATAMALAPDWSGTVRELAQAAMSLHDRPASAPAW